ncbi:MAG: DUF4082 domain-containing protein, partial [Methylobacter sp.]
MKNSKNKYHFLKIGLSLAILMSLVFVQGSDNVGPVKSASATQVLETPSMERYSDKLEFVAFSADGNTLANLDFDGKITIWDVNSGTLRQTLLNQAKSAVIGIAFSPDGNTLASVSDNSISLWDINTAEVRRILPVIDFVTFLIFSPDSKTLAVVDQDTRITLWNSLTGTKIHELNGHKRDVNKVTFRPDNMVLASGDLYGELKFWDVKTGQEQESLIVETGVAITDLIFSRDGKTLAVLDEEARVTLMESQTHSIIQIPAGHQGGINVMAFSPDSHILASGGQDAKIKLWDRATGLEKISLTGGDGTPITNLTFSSDGKRLASVGENEWVNLWDVSKRLSTQLTGHTDWVDKVVFSANEKTLAGVSKTGQVVVWDLKTELEQQSFQIPALPGASSMVRGAQTSLDANLTHNDTIQTSISQKQSISDNKSLTDIGSQVDTKDNTVKPKKRSAKNWKGVIALALSPDDSEFATGGEDGTLLVIKKNGVQRWKVSGHHGSAITGISFQGKSKQDLISVGRDTETKIWNSAGKNLQTFYGPEHPPRAVAVSPDGSLIATAGEETRVFLFDAVAGKLKNILTGHVDFVNGLAFSPDGKFLASAGAEGRILLWDVATGKRSTTLLGHADEVNSVAFSPDGQSLASASEDSVVILWDHKAGIQLTTLAGHQGSVRSVAFNPNGKELVSGGIDTKMLVWNASTGQLMKQLTGPPAAINVLTFGPDGNLYVASENSEVSVFNTETNKKIKSIKIPETFDKDPLVSLSEVADESTDADLAILESASSGYGESKSSESEDSSQPALYLVINQLLDWIIPAANAAMPPPLGGPSLVITSSSSLFGNYYAEILRTEGLNSFSVADISTVDAASLANYDVAILAPAVLTNDQATLLTQWVEAGGNLIAMRPDAPLFGLLGLTDTGSDLSDGYLLVDTSRAPGYGIVNQTMQFHGTADRYNLSGASSLATLYSSADTATTHPALTLRDVGTNGGQAAAFAYDLATSVVYTRQGNPAWATQERDGYAPIRSDDKFYGDASGDPQADWIDLNKVAIPQADEQQRLLVNLILEMNQDKKPLPRFWYFPHGKKAVVIMTGDDHANNGTEGRFDQFIAESQPGCSVTDWECIRGTSYIFPDTPLTAAKAEEYHALGFEVGLHINTNCADFTPESLRTFYTEQINAFTSKYTNIPAPITQRHHCIAWSDWVTGAIVQLENGIRFDTSYYFWPPSWVLNRPGFFSGSGMPMRFANLDGSIIDVYHVATQMTDESGQTYPFSIDTLLDRAQGTEGYYGAFTINAHTDLPEILESDAVIASARPRGVPIVSSKQMMDWLDGRNSSSFNALSWDDASKTLSFSVTAGAGAKNLRGMLPASTSAGILLGITYRPSGGSEAPVGFSIEPIKGITYGFFPALTGTYTATYGSDTTPPTVTAKSPSEGSTGLSQSTIVTVTFSEPMDAATINGSTFELRDSTNTLVLATINYNATTQTATLVPSASLAGSTTYSATVKGGAVDPRVKDLSGNALASSVTWSFTTEAQPCLASPCSTWPSSTIPGTPSVNDPGSVELGVKFRSDLDGFITGIRFYQANPGSYTGTLWSLGGQQLATGNVTATAPGWQQVIFSAPVAITANTVYVASYHAPNGNYAATNTPEFSLQGVDNPPLHLLKDGENGGNGVYAYSASTTFPSNTYNSSNYWVDVEFSTNAGSDTTAPTVTSQSPSPNATGVPTNATVTATFSETMDEATISGSTFELRGPAPDNALINAIVSYNASTRTATLIPSEALSA